jgi:hypothetical protein
MLDKRAFELEVRYTCTENIDVYTAGISVKVLCITWGDLVLRGTGTIRSQQKA